MPNNNVAILSIMSKFDEKSAREAAKRADKVYEEALSDIGNVNFDKKLIENFDKAMNLLKNKFKKVNLSSYTNSLLDSIFSDKDIKEKSKDIELFISKIEMLKKASSGQDINAFNTFSAKQIDALISRTEKLAQKQEEINEKTREYSREATKIAKSNRSISTIDKNYGNQDYSKTLESLKKSLGTEKEFTVEQNQSIENLAKMVSLYQIMEKSEPQKGTAEAIRYSKDLLAVTQKIKEERDKIDAFSKKGASTYIANNGLSSVDKVSDYTVSRSKEDFVKASLSNLKSQEAKLQSELTTYISDSVQKNLAKVSKEVDAVVDKAEKRVENLQNKIESLQGKSEKDGSSDSVIGNIISDSDIKSLEEIEDRLYAISDLDAEGEATKQQLKEYIQLYKQYEQLIANDSTVKFDPGLKEEYDSIIESDSKLKKYADTLDETISKQKELNAVKSNENEVFVDTQTEQLAKQEEQIKETIQAEKQLQDTQEKVSSNTKISVDAEQAIADINKIKESLDSIPEEKNIKITISDSDYTNTPLLSDAEGNTITAFRGVVGAWSGLINQDGIGFFTDKLKLAADYADSLAESGKVYQANLSFKNPLEIEGNGAKWDEIDFNGVKKTTDEIVELAKQLGYDGVIFKNIRDGFTDADEDISNVMVALNAAQIKNEQVIGTVKAGTGEMVDVASKIDNATDTATNSAVESQNKIQEELKETQKVAEQVSEAMNSVGSNKSNISSENSIVENQNQLKENKKLTDENISSLYEFIKLCQEQARVLGETNEELKERAAYFKDENISGKVSVGTHYAGNHDASILDGANSDIHSHFSKYASFSESDLFNLKEQLKNFMVMGTDELTHLDLSGINEEILRSITLRYDTAVKELNQQFLNNLSIKDNLKFTDIEDIPESIFEKAFEYAEQSSNIDYDYNKYDEFFESEIKRIREKLLQGASLNDIVNVASEDISKFEVDGVSDDIKQFKENFVDGIRGYLSNILQENDVFNPDKLLNLKEYNDGRNNALRSVLDDLGVGADRLKTIDISNLEEGYTSVLNVLGLVNNKQEEVIQTAKQVETNPPIEDVFQGNDNSNISFSSNLDEIEKEKSALLELRNTVSLIIEEIDRKTQAFHNEKSAVDLIIPEEIATLESLERELKIIIESIEQISKIPINIDFNLENLDENSTNAISKLKDSLSGFNGSSLTNISSILEGLKISKANVENLQKLSNAILTLKSNLNNVGNSGKQFLSDIKELVAQSDGLKDLATILKSSQKQIDNAKKTTNANVDSKNTEENTNAWKELTYSIQRYSEVSKRISSGKALEGDIEEASRLENKISQLQKLDILSPTQVEKSEQMLTKLYDSLDDIEKKSKETTLESLNSSIDKYRNDYNSRSSKPVVNNQSDEYKKLLANYETSVEKLEAYRDKISNNPLVSKEDLNQIDELTKKVKESATAFNSLTASQKGSTPLSRGKTIEWANDLLEQNSKWSKKAKIEVQGWINKLATADPSNVEEIRNRILEIVRAEREAGNAGKTWLDIFSTKKLHNFLGQAASMFSFYDLINVGRQIVTNINDIDTALTELRKVSDATEQRLTANFKNSADTAKELGATISDVISATADWSRMGYNIDQAEELARVSTLYKNVGDGIDIETANNSLISTLQGFQLDASEAESIIDKFNEVANNYAIDSAGIGEALQRSAASFNAANTDLSKSIALITATNEVVQDPDSVGTLWKTMSARIRGAETELQQLNEETDEYTKTTSKLRDLVMGLTGFDIMEDEDTFKDIYEIILGIGQEWQNLTDAEQASLGEALAGKRNANALYAVLGNLETLQSAYETAENSAGSAMREQENYEKSIQYSLDRLSASAQEWSNTLVSSDVIKWFVDLANAAVELSTALTPLGTLALGGGIFAGFKNIGRPKMFGLYKYADINMCSLGY